MVKLQVMRMIHVMIMTGWVLLLGACVQKDTAGETSSMTSQTQRYTPVKTDDLTIQLAVDDSHPLILPNHSAIMEVDLFDTDASVFSTLHARGTKVLCYFSAGSWENWREDAQAYPQDIIGNDYDGWPGEKWVDIRDERLKPILQARLDKARDRGCDGVDPDNVNGYENNTGFPLTAQDQLAFNRWLAQEAHARGLFIALKNDGNQAAELVDDFDAVVSEQCYAYDECDLFDPFLAANKPVWDIEYTNNTKDYRDGDVWNVFCQASNAAGRHGYWLPDNLDGSFRHSCQRADNLWNDLSIGMGDSTSFSFQKTGGGTVWLQASTVILDSNLAQNSEVQTILNVDTNAFDRLHRALSKVDFLSVWATRNWQENWYYRPTIEALAKAGKAMVFNYWYFGDDLSNGMPNDAEKAAYLDDVTRLGRFIASLPGPVVVNFEPEFNKPSVMDRAETRNAFVQLISQAIDRLKAEAPDALVSLTLVDTGRRSETDTSADCGYANCALGDRAAWEKLRPIYDALADRLDLLSFQQMLAQFSRNPANDTVPIAYDNRTIGVNLLAQRIVNLTTWLHDTWHKPVMMPYLAIATATWNDANGDGAIQDGEVDLTGWEDEAQNVMDQLRSASVQQTLRQHGMMGMAGMVLFDNPQHDAGGYQFFLNNEYHLGFVATGARDAVDPRPDGALRFKGANGRSLLEILLARP